MVHDVEGLIATLLIAIALGVAAMHTGRRTSVSYVPLFIILGIIFGPILGILSRSMSRTLFDYVRIFGLLIILFAEGHTLHWSLLKKHIFTIGVLDTVGLVITAFIAGFFFSMVFHVPFLAGFLFGAIISATDPATLIPLFHQYKVREDIRIVLVTESIFNDPLGIVLTSVAVALVLPQAPSARFIESIAAYTNIPVAATLYFLYEVSISIILGIILGYFGYWMIRALRFYESTEEVVTFSIALALLGFFIGEELRASGYLVATTIGIILGNHHHFFKEPPRMWGKMRSAIDTEQHFNELLAIFAILLIFVLLGASVSLKVLVSTFVQAVIVALTVIFIARPVAALPILKTGKWSWGEYLFISLEGPRGVVPSALAALPLSLGIAYHNSTLIYWGELILSATLVTILLSIILETLWLPILRKKLLGEVVEKEKREEEVGEEVFPELP